MVLHVGEDAFSNNESFQLAVQMHVRRYFRADGSLPIAEEILLPVLESVKIEAMKPLYKRLMGQALTNMITVNALEMRDILKDAETSRARMDTMTDQMELNSEVSRVTAAVGRATELQKAAIWINALVEAIPDA